MNDLDKPGGGISRLLRELRGRFGGRQTQPAPTFEADSKARLSATELISVGLGLRQTQGITAARPFFEQAVALEPNSYLAFFMLGNAASEMRDLDAAVRCYERARDLQPSDHVVRYNLGLNQFWRGYMDAAIAELAKAREIAPSYLPAQSAFIMALLNSDKVNAKQIDTAIFDFGQQLMARSAPVEPLSRPTIEPKRLRVGFISGDFRTHSVAQFLEPIASGRDRNSFYYIFYANNRQQDAVTQRFRSYADAWRDVWQLKDNELLQLLRDDEIHILVDLSGHTDSNRLAVFARRAAPVQITYLGFPNSTGLQTMDYRITDSVTDPSPPASNFRSEALLLMPDTQWCFRPFGNPPAPEATPAITAGFVTFGSFNNLAKLSNLLLRCWVSILTELPEARLRLTRVRSEQRAQEILALFGDAGIRSDRIDCVTYRDDAPHGTQFAGVDIALDSYPYNGVTTSCECLYMGVPLVSLQGSNCSSRSGLAILKAVALGELVAANPEEYVDIAVALAHDLPRLDGLRSSLRARFEESSLRDERRFAQNFEILLKRAWDNPV